MDKQSSDLAHTVTQIAHRVEETTNYEAGLGRARRTLALLASLRTDDADALPGDAIADAAREAAEQLAAADAELLAIRADLLALGERIEDRCAEAVA